MWQYRHAVETTQAAPRIWALWSDVDTWHDWNPDVEGAAVDGPFRAGSRIAMTLGGGDVVDLRLVDVVPGERFTDEATMDGVTLRTEHRLEPAPDGATRVVYATTVTGDVPGEVLAEIGGAVTADFPQTVEGLLRAARQAGHAGGGGSL